jgi:hypothetical protein
MPSLPNPLNPFSYLDPSAWVRLPLSGDVAQNYHPLTNWFSPNIDIKYVGNSSIERDVTANVAGYGSQLGTVIDVLEELTRGKEQTEAVKRLRDLWCKVEEVKKNNKEDLKESAKASLDQLAKYYPDGLQDLIKAYAR